MSFIEDLFNGFNNLNFRLENTANYVAVSVNDNENYVNIVHCKTQVTTQNNNIYKSNYILPDIPKIKNKK